MYKQQIILNRLERLFSVPKCKDQNYSRKKNPPELIKKVYEEQGGKCFLCECKTTIPMTHHIQPDGESTRENLVMLCILCHQWAHWILKKHLGYRGTMKPFRTGGNLW